MTRGEGEQGRVPGIIGLIYSCMNGRSTQKKKGKRQDQDQDQVSYLGEGGSGKDMEKWFEGVRYNLPMTMETASDKRVTTCFSKHIEGTGKKVVPNSTRHN